LRRPAADDLLRGLVSKASRKPAALRWRWLIPAVIVVILLQFTPFGGALDRRFFDAAVQNPFRPSTPPDGSAIVIMDNSMLEKLSKHGFGVTWPPPRAVFAALIAGLHRAGAERIILDFVFLDHSAAAEQDALLAALAAGVPSVVLGRTTKQTPAFWDERFIAAHKTLFAQSRTGTVETPTDRDGVIREYAVPGSLAAAAFADRPNVAGGLVQWHGGLEKFRTSKGTKRVPVLSATEFVLAGLPTIGRLAELDPNGNYAPQRVATALQAESPLTGATYDAVRGRVVFVGATATSSFDIKPFAIGGTEPGVLVHWTAWTNIVQDAFIRRVPTWVPLVMAVIFLGGLATMAAQKSGVLGPVIAAVSLLALTLFGAYAGISFGWFLSPTVPAAAATLGLIGVLTEKFWLERKRRHDIQATFGVYVAREIVEMLVRDPGAIRLRGEKREATVFFCDLAGFTELSEQVTPEELVELINGYLEETSDCLMSHGAYVDKYIGDAVMAVFGAPQNQPDHAIAACRAALGAQRQLALRNTALTVSHGRTLGMRIGINTGEMIVGNLGSERKKNYTVIGDAVNLASRLEGANKEFGTSILLGEMTANRVRDTLVVRPLTALRVKGKQTAVPVFELVGERGEITAEQQVFLDVYGEGHALYTSRRFAEAADVLARAAKLAPLDEMTRHLLADARVLGSAPPPDDWLPVLSLKTK
jgi:adenylate cyclase